MATQDPRVDTYIEEAEGFARPILRHLRSLIHQACPEVEETIKWNMPFFVYRGNFCFFAAFKKHCGLGFWRGLDVIPPEKRVAGAMGDLGPIEKQEDLPSDKELLSYLRAAVALRAQGGKTKTSSPRRAALPVPEDFQAVLAKNKKASAAWQTFTASHQREYIQWITSAKREETRQRRVTEAVQRILAHDR